MTSDKLKYFAQHDRETLVKAFQGILVDFGYNGLESTEVDKHITSYMNDEPEPSGIIPKFIYGWLTNGIEE